MTEILGLPLDDALLCLAQAGVVSPEIEYTAGRKTHETGTLRVVRVQEGGRKLTVARFPDCIEMLVRPERES